MNKKISESINSNSPDKNYKNDKLHQKTENKEKNKILQMTALTRLPMTEREYLKEFINSRIFFTLKEFQFVKNRVVNNTKNKHSYFEVLYRASIDGDYEDKIIFCCEGIYPQLILFFTEEGARFGLYIEKKKINKFFR